MKNPVYVGKQPKSGDHDYDPEWDYRLSSFRQEEALAVVGFLDLFWRDTGLTDPTVYAVTGLGRSIAKYVAGTASQPVIVVSVTKVRSLAKRHGLTSVLETTLAHEMGHAYLEANGVDPEDHNESLVEDAGAALLRSFDTKVFIGVLRHHRGMQ